MDGLLTFAGQSFEYRTARRIAEGFEDRVRIGQHLKTITFWLWDCQAAQ
jgi:hypothetical protein